MKNSKFKVVVALGTLITTGTNSFNVQAFALEGSWKHHSISIDGIIAQSKTSNELFEQAAELLLDLKYDEALILFDQVVKLNPHSSEVWYWHGYTLNQVERFSDAIASFNKAIELNPNYPEALYEKGNALYSLGRYQEALYTCEQGLKIDKDNKNFLMLQSLVFSTKNRKNEVIALLERAKKLEENGLEITRLLAAIQNSGVSISESRRLQAILVALNEEVRAAGEKLVATQPQIRVSQSSIGELANLLQELEILKTTYKIYITTQSLEGEAKQKLAALLAELERKQGQVKPFYQEWQTSRERLVVIESEITIAQEQLESFRTELQKWEERLVTVRRDIKTGSDQSSASQKKLRALEQQLVVFRDEVYTINARLEKFSSELGQLEQRIEQRSKSIDAMLVPLRDFRARVNELLNRSYPSKNISNF